MKKFKKSIIVFGMPGTGKTYACHRRDNCIDLESSRFQWIDGETKMASEAAKGTSRDKNPAWPQNY